MPFSPRQGTWCDPAPRRARSVRQRLQDILDAIAHRAVHAGKSFEAFLADAMLRDAVERNIERISEASRHIPEELTVRHPSIRWRAIADIGNVLRHAYDGVDDKQTWQVAARDLDGLKAAVTDMMEKTGKTAGAKD
jgi:uncharacterized protein with HEPN domain